MNFLVINIIEKKEQGQLIPFSSIVLNRNSKVSDLIKEIKKVFSINFMLTCNEKRMDNLEQKLIDFQTDEGSLDVYMELERAFSHITSVTEARTTESPKRTNVPINNWTSGSVKCHTSLVGNIDYSSPSSKKNSIPGENLWISQSGAAYIESSLQAEDQYNNRRFMTERLYNKNESFLKKHSRHQNSSDDVIDYSSLRRNLESSEFSSSVLNIPGMTKVKRMRSNTDGMQDLLRGNNNSDHAEFNFNGNTEEEGERNSLLLKSNHVNDSEGWDGYQSGDDCNKDQLPRNEVDGAFRALRHRENLLKNIDKNSNGLKRHNDNCKRPKYSDSNNTNNNISTANNEDFPRRRSPSASPKTNYNSFHNEAMVSLFKQVETGGHKRDLSPPNRNHNTIFDRNYTVTDPTNTIYDIRMKNDYSSFYNVDFDENTKISDIDDMMNRIEINDRFKEKMRHLFQSKIPISQNKMLEFKDMSFNDFTLSNIGIDAVIARSEAIADEKALKLNLVLDIDSTLLFANSAEKNQSYLNNDKEEIFSTSLTMDTKVYNLQYKLRRYVVDFLKRMSKFCNIFINTHGQEFYAIEVLKIISEKSGIEIKEHQIRALKQPPIMFQDPPQKKLSQ